MSKTKDCAMRPILLPVCLLSVLSASAEIKNPLRPVPKPAPDAPKAKAEPAPDTVTHVTFQGPKKGWGFVQTPSPYYSPQGKNLGPLPGGTLFTYNDVKSSSKNAMLVAMVRADGTWRGPFLLDCTDIMAFEGDVSSVSPQTVQNLSAYFSLKGKIAEREAALTEATHAANPHFVSARQAQKTYQESISKAAAMEAKANTLSGAFKSRALEDMRAFKYEQVRLKTKADQEAAAYKAWKDAHPVKPGAFASDPQLAALNQALQAARAKVANLIP